MDMAEAAKHTAGPWQIRDDYTAEGLLTVIANVDGEYIDGRAVCTYDTVAICEDEYGEALPNARANARLIAAAPGMLAALRLVRSSTEWSCMERDTQDAVDIAICAAISQQPQASPGNRKDGEAQS